MKRLLLSTALILGTLSGVKGADAASFNQDIACIVDNCPLIDGKNLKGAPCTYSCPVTDIHRLDNDTELAWATESQFRTMLRDPIKKIGWMHNTFYTASELKRVYSELIHFSSQFNPSALRFFWHVLEDGNVYGAYIPGLTPQPERAALYKELYEWCIGTRPDANHALEAVRTDKRERLDAIMAEEAAKRKTDARIRAALTTRYQRPHGLDDEHASAREPLLPRGKLKAH